MLDEELLAEKVTRFRCPHCRRSFSNRTYARKHLAICQKREANHGCKLCAFFADYEPSNHADGYPGCDRYCSQGQDISERLRTDCLHWEPII